MNQEFEQLKNWIEENKNGMVELETLLSSIPALAPENNGEGEIKKAQALEEWLKSNGIKNIQHYDAPDERVPSKIRPNIVAEIPGNKDDYTIWVCAHMDVVPPGDLSYWKTDPWKVVEKDGILYGRGVEDNQQGLVSGVFAALSFVKQHIIPEHTIKLLFMADEEVGSDYGMKYLLKEHRDIFKPEDIILIPDGGDSDGVTIEVSEKSVYWLKFHTYGKQVHGSTPNYGINSFLANCELALKVNSLEKSLDARSDFFDPPYSTFQPTMAPGNVEAVNIIPGEDIFCCDCRILPCYSIEFVRGKINELIDEVEKKYGVRVEVEELQKHESPETPVTAKVVTELTAALKEVHGKTAVLHGSSGATVGAELRIAGIDCAIWSTMECVCHEPNEYCIIDNIVKDAQTIAFMAIN